jgi:hypothetical protein
MRTMPAIVAVAMLAAGAFSPANGAEETALMDAGSGKVHVGTGVICDTQAEVTNFVRLISEHDPSGALQQVNRTSASPMACGMATVAFRTGKNLGEVRTDKGSFNIVEIEIIAGSVNGNWQMVPNRTQYTAVAVSGYDI